MSESKISCPHCGQHALIDDAWAGQTINCPSCQQAFVLPSAPPTAQYVAPAPAPGLRVSTSAGPPPIPSAAARSQSASPAKKTSGLAIASVILSVLGCTGITAIAGIICGHLARGRIRRNPSLGGGGLALAGLIVGYVMLGLSILLAIPLVEGFKRGWDEAKQRRAARIQFPQSVPGQSPPRGINTNPIIKSDVSVPDGAISGKIQGQEFTYSRATLNKFMGMLTVDQGEHFHADQEVKIVGLVRPNESLADRTWTITPTTYGNRPTVWLTWKQNGQSRTDAPQNYNLEIKTGGETNGVITGTLSFSCTGRVVASVKGNFAAKVE